MSKSYLGKSRITILDKTWTVFFKDDDQYKKLKIEASRAATVMGDRHIYFNCACVKSNDKVVIHELVHAYTYELMGHDLAMQPTEFEEFFATLFEKRGEDIIKQSKPLTKQLYKFARKLDLESGDNDGISS